VAEHQQLFPHEITIFMWYKPFPVMGGLSVLYPHGISKSHLEITMFVG
jgi:hypothetical protein